MLSPVACPVLPYFINGTIFEGKKVTEREVFFFLFLFSVQICLKHFSYSTELNEI